MHGSRRARALLPELESSRGACRASEASGAVVAAWVDELRATFDAARRDAKDADPDAAKSPLPTSEDAKKVAKDLGAKVGAFERALGPEGKKYGDYARERFFPKGDAHAWGEIVLSAAVRAYVPLVDPHGAWAPYDEEASVYDVDLAANAPEALWARGDLTSVGVAIVEGPVAPFEVGDVVVSIADLAAAGNLGGEAAGKAADSLKLLAETAGIPVAAPAFGAAADLVRFLAERIAVVRASGSLESAMARAQPAVDRVAAKRFQ